MEDMTDNQFFFIMNVLKILETSETIEEAKKKVQDLLNQ